MNKKMLLIILIVCASNNPAHAVKFIFKGGASNSIDLAIFKKEANFANFIKYVHGSKDIARDIEEITQENSAIVGEITGKIGKVVLTEKGSDESKISLVVPLIKAGTTLATELIGHLSITTAYIIREAAKKTVNHYKEDMKPGSSACYGLSGKNRLIRHKPFPIGKNELMDPNNRQDIFIAIFNKGTIKDDAGNLIARSNDVIYAGPIKAENLGAAYEIKTYILTQPEMEEDGVTHKKDESGNEIIKVALAVDLKKTNDTEGEDCS